MQHLISTNPPSNTLPRPDLEHTMCSVNLALNTHNNTTAAASSSMHTLPPPNTSTHPQLAAIGGCALSCRRTRRRNPAAPRPAAAPGPTSAPTLLRHCPQLAATLVVAAAAAAAAEEGRHHLCIGVARLWHTYEEQWLWKMRHDTASEHEPQESVLAVHPREKTRDTSSTCLRAHPDPPTLLAKPTCSHAPPPTHTHLVVQHLLELLVLLLQSSNLPGKVCH